MASKNTAVNFDPLINKAIYWKDHAEGTVLSRAKSDLDCILTGGNLFADTLFSLWLPLRYTLNASDTDRWNKWKRYEEEELKKTNMGLKKCPDFLADLSENPGKFIPDGSLARKLTALFGIGQSRANIIILPFRDWNRKRGSAPFWDYMPHFLQYILSCTENETFRRAVISWIKEERLEMFFEGGIIDRAHIRDLAGTGNVRLHSPEVINIHMLLENYVKILREREALILKTA